MCNNGELKENDSDIANGFDNHFIKIVDTYVDKIELDVAPDLKPLKTFIKKNLSPGNVFVIPDSLSWFTSYLSNKTQQVKYKSKLSEPLPVTYGVPQGSILRPLLLLFVINDFTS